MEKIIYKALQLAGFQNAGMIARIINCVPNPQVATEMLLGVYEDKPLNLAERFRKSRYAGSEELLEITSIDDLGNIVTFNKFVQKKKTVYYVTKQDKENDVYVTERPKDYVDYTSKPTTGYTTSEEKHTINEFNDKYSTVVSINDATSKLASWNLCDVEPVLDVIENELPF
jgi:hypothetical protein